MAAELGQHRQRGERPVGDDQRAPAANVPQVPGDDRPARTGAESGCGVGNEKRVMVSMVVIQLVNVIQQQPLPLDHRD